MTATVIVYSLDDAVAALSVAKERGFHVTLQSAPNAAAFLGPMVFKAMIDQARESVPGTQSIAVLDCGADAGYAQNALRHGLEAVSIGLQGPARIALEDIARQVGVTIIAAQDDALDLQMASDPLRACKKWLTNEA